MPNIFHWNFLFRQAWATYMLCWELYVSNSKPAANSYLTKEIIKFLFSLRSCGFDQTLVSLQLFSLETSFKASLVFPQGSCPLPEMQEEKIASWTSVQCFTLTPTNINQWQIQLNPGKNWYTVMLLFGFNTQYCPLDSLVCAFHLIRFFWYFITQSFIKLMGSIYWAQKTYKTKQVINHCGWSVD